MLSAYRRIRAERSIVQFLVGIVIVRQDDIELQSFLIFVLLEINGDGILIDIDIFADDFQQFFFAIAADKKVDCGECARARPGFAIFLSPEAPFWV